MGRWIRRWPGRRTMAMREWMLEQRARSIERGDWEELAEDRAEKGLPPPMGLLSVGGGMPTPDKYALGLGRAGLGSGWDIPDLVEYDYSFANIAAASTTPGLILGLIPTTNSGFIGSYEGLGSSLAAAVSNRVIGTGSTLYALVLNCYILARTSAGAVYAPAAGSTLQLQVASMSGATQASDNLTTAQTLSALTNFWTQQTITGPAGRTFSLTGTALAAAACFYGDALFATLVTTAALNIQGNTLSMVLEMS